MRKGVLLLCATLCASAPGWSMGRLGETTPAEAPTNSQGALAVGGTLPGSILLADEQGVERNIPSFLSYRELTVLGFFSSRCPENREAWPQVAKFYREYKNWSTRFIGITADPGEVLSELTQAARQAGLDFPFAADKTGDLRKILGIQRVPAVVILDPWRSLRYRGPLKNAPEALKALLGYEPVPHPEPPFPGGCPVAPEPAP